MQNLFKFWHSIREVQAIEHEAQRRHRATLQTEFATMLKDFVAY